MMMILAQHTSNRDQSAMLSMEASSWILAHRDAALTFSCLFFRMGVRRGSRSLMGGVILVMPMTFTMALSAPKMLPSTSGYSSPRYSYSTTPRCPSSFSSLHVCSQQHSVRQTAQRKCPQSAADGQGRPYTMPCTSGLVSCIRECNVCREPQPNSNEPVCSQVCCTPS